MSGFVRSSLVCVALAAVLQVAASGPARGDRLQEATDSPDSVTVWVQSYYWGPVHVYAREGGHLHSIGVVVTNDTIRDRMGLVSSRRRIRLIAEPVGSRSRYQTGSIAFSPGDRIEWIVGSELPMSMVFVYSGDEGGQ